MKRCVCVLLGILCLSLPTTAQQKDSQGCKDHPLFPRMPEYWIHSCVEKEFKAHVFTIDEGKTLQVEGQYWEFKYYPIATLKFKPSERQILQNFETAVAQLGGKVLYQKKSSETFRLIRDDKEIWVEVWAEYTGKYGLFVVEKKVMQQDVVGNADAFLNALRTAGHAAVYGICFDAGKSEVKSESDPALAEIARLLMGNVGLNVYVVSHTDNVGGPEANLKLSQGRAEAVMHALERSHGIAASRLKAYGVGPYAPVATNETEDGRAKNCRVELVQQ